MAIDTLPQGVFPTMITPFRDDLSIDWPGVDAVVDYYLGNDAAGVFAVCGSSELPTLSHDERFELAARVVRRAGGAPVVASATFGGPLVRQAEDVKRMRDAGVAAVVVLTSEIAEPGASDSQWMDRLRALLDLTAGVPLGFYEIPGPNKRLLTPRMLRATAETGRFLFHKDTSCRLDLIEKKARATEGTALGFYNANASSVLHSLRCGGAGYSGIASNYYPRLWAWLCGNWREEPRRAEDLQTSLAVWERAAGSQYPAGAKAYLNMRGVPIGTACRSGSASLAENDLRILASLVALVERAEGELCGRGGSA